MSGEDDARGLLSPTATVAERTRGLLKLLPPAVLADAVGVKVSSLRNWTVDQSRPRFDAAIALDDLRATAKVLLDGGLEEARVTAWLTSRDPDVWEGQRPVELIRVDPLDVLQAAQGLVLDHAQEEEDRRHRKRRRKLALASSN